VRARRPYRLYKIPDSDCWHVYFLTRDGRTFRKSTRETIQSRAHAVARQWEHEQADPTHSASHATTIDTAAGNLKTELQDRGRASETIKFYGVKLSHVARVLGGDMPLATVTAARVDGYIAARKREGAAKYTISKELTCLRMLLKTARRRGEFDRELSQVMPVAFATGYKPRTRRLTIEEAWALIGELPDGPARYVAFVCATTARDAAVARAKGRDMTPKGIRVHDRKTKGATRTVPLTVVTEAFARRAFDGIAPEALVASGVSSVRHAFDRAAKRLGMAHVSPNDLRRSVAHWLLEAGAPRDLAAAFMGHGSTKMLDLVYGKLDAVELGAALGRSLSAPKSGGSSLQPPCKNGSDSPDPVDGVDSGAP
jgi:integrase